MVFSLVAVSSDKDSSEKTIGRAHERSRRQNLAERVSVYYALSLISQGLEMPLKAEGLNQDLAGRRFALVWGALWAV